MSKTTIKKLLQSMTKDEIIGLVLFFPPPPTHLLSKRKAE